MLVNYFKKQYKSIYPRLSLYIISVILLCSSCSNTKYLPAGTKLYDGADVTINAEDNSIDAKHKKQIAGDLKKLVRPDRNKTILGLKPKLWIYNIMGNPKRKKGVRAWIKRKLGEPPVTMSQVDMEKNRELIVNRLQNRGYFQAQAYYKTSEAKGKVKVHYFANISQAYTVARYRGPADTDMLINLYVRKALAESPIHTGSEYNLDQLKAERERITGYVKSEGFYYFSSDFLIFHADTTVGSRTINMDVAVKKSTPQQALKVYKISDVYVYPRYSLTRADSSRKKLDSTVIDDYIYMGSTKIFHPKRILNSIFIEKGDIYDEDAYDLTLHRLVDMGIFKFVSIKFKEQDTTSKGDTGILRAYVYLTPFPKRNIRTEFNLVSKSDNFAGPTVSVSLKNRNLFHGAELLTHNANGSLETLLSGERSGVFSYVIGADARLQVPRFISPIHIPDPGSRFVPKTIFTVGFQKLSRVDYYNLNSFSTAAGYAWNETLRKSHELYPISITYLQLGHTTEAFDALIKNNVSLKRSFENQFILASTYAYTYTTLTSPGTRKHDLYFNGTIGISGNVAHTVQSMFETQKGTPDDPYKILGTPYSQFTRVTLEGRHYFNINPHEKIATRLFVGAGLPYGNSSTMPYTQLFFSGGNNSIRAFPTRSLGPGSYHLPDSLLNSFVDQGADIKLEGNIEYRFDIISIVKGAFFVDAGNIWNANKDTSQPGGEFRFNRFYKEIAVGTGFGIRLDASYFVLRFDLGVPLRKPYLPEGQRWVIDKIELADPVWRKNNLVLNIAIGYPF